MAAWDEWAKRAADAEPETFGVGPDDEYVEEEQTEEASRGGPGGMAMNGPLASAERAAERSTEILPAQPVPLWESDGEPQRCWVIAGRLAAAMLGDHGISRVQPVFRPIAADEFFFLVWIRPDGGQMVLIEPDGRQRKHHVLPGREG